MMEDQKELISAIDRLVTAIEALKEVLLLNQEKHVQKVPWHDTFTEDTPLSMMAGFKLISQTGINSLRSVGITTFGDLIRYTGQFQKNYSSLSGFGPASCADLVRALEIDGVLIEYFKCFR
jgi:hypothetical protein